MAIRVPLEQASWRLTLYPEAGEAGGSFVSARRVPHVWVPPGQAADPVRAKAEAARRARKKLRLYCAANGLNRMGTLTYEGGGCHDPRQLRADVAGFFRDLRAGLGGQPFSYVWVPEWHKTDHGLHLHFAVGQFIHRTLIRDTWGHGNIWIGLKYGLGSSDARREHARRCAGYLAKYVAKTFDREDLGGLHRYEVAQGFQPRALRYSGVSVPDVVGQASREMGSEPARRWSSDEVEGWDLPPAVSFQWA